MNAKGNMKTVHAWLMQCGWKYEKVMNVSDVDIDTFVINIQKEKFDVETFPVYVNRKVWEEWISLGKHKETV